MLKEPSVHFHLFHRWPGGCFHTAVAQSTRFLRSCSVGEKGQPSFTDPFSTSSLRFLGTPPFNRQATQVSIVRTAQVVLFRAGFGGFPRLVQPFHEGTPTPNPQNPHCGAFSKKGEPSARFFRVIRAPSALIRVFSFSPSVPSSSAFFVSLQPLKIRTHGAPCNRIARIAGFLPREAAERERLKAEFEALESSATAKAKADASRVLELQATRKSDASGGWVGGAAIGFWGLRSWGKCSTRRSNAIFGPLKLGEMFNQTLQCDFWASEVGGNVQPDAPMRFLGL